MKQNLFKKLLLSLVVSVVVALCLYACKKEFVTPLNNSTITTSELPDYSAEAQDIVRKIKGFKAKISDKETMMRSGEFMPLDSVIWNIESLLNATYTFPERKYIETVKQKLDFSVNINSDNCVSAGDVALLYEEVFDGVRQAYANDGVSVDKSLMAVVLKKGEIVGSSVDLDVYVISGKVKNEVSSNSQTQGPFKPGDFWYYGEYGGTCSDPSVFGDAAEIIEDTINYYWRGKSVPREGFRQLNVNMTMIALEGNEFVDEEGKPYIYFYTMNGNPPLCLNYELLNYYYYRELEVLMHLLPESPAYQAKLPVQPAFLEVDIIGMMNYVGYTSCFQHKNYVVYCSSFEIPETVIGTQDILSM